MSKQIILHFPQHVFTFYRLRESFKSASHRKIPPLHGGPFPKKLVEINGRKLEKSCQKTPFVAHFLPANTKNWHNYTDNNCTGH